MTLCDFHWSHCFHLALSNSSHRNAVCKEGCDQDCQGITYEVDPAVRDLKDNPGYDISQDV